MKTRGKRVSSMVLGYERPTIRRKGPNPVLWWVMVILTVGMGIVSGIALIAKVVLRLAGYRQ